MIVTAKPSLSTASYLTLSLTNLAKIFGNHNGLTYLLSVTTSNEFAKEASVKLKLLGELVDCNINTPSVREGASKALTSLRKLIAENQLINSIFYGHSFGAASNFVAVFSHKNTQHFRVVF